jgi:hypothetical protein
MAFLPPVPTMGRSVDDRDAVIEDVRAAMAARLAEKGAISG